MKHLVDIFQRSVPFGMNRQITQIRFQTVPLWGSIWASKVGANVQPAGDILVVAKALALVNVSVFTKLDGIWERCWVIVLAIGPAFQRPLISSGEIFLVSHRWACSFNVSVKR